MSVQAYGGTIVGDTFTVQLTDEWRSGVVSGYRIPVEVFDKLVDEGIEWTVFIDPNRGRYTASIDDWLDYSFYEDDERHLSQSRMTRG